MRTRLASVLICVVAAMAGARVIGTAQTEEATPRLVAALRRMPAVTWASTLGFRDWGPAVRAGGLLVASNITGGGGLYAVDDATGKLRWRAGQEGTSGPPVSDGKVVAVAYTRSESIAAYTVTSGKPVWRRPSFRFVNDTSLTLAGGVVLAAEATSGVLHALDLGTGTSRWTLQVTPKFWHCGAGPVVHGDTVYVASGLQPPADARSDYFLHAIDLKTGQERWRYNPPPEYPNRGTCLTRLVVAGDTVVAAGDGYLYGVDRESGRQKYRAEPLDGNRRLPMTDLATAGDLVLGITTTNVGGFDARTGRLAWKVPGAFREHVGQLAVADGVVYVEGRLASGDAAATNGDALHAIDLATRDVLWTFRHPSEVSWPFSHMVPFDGGLYVDTYKVLLKLQ